jgi:hypothetical protein
VVGPASSSWIYSMKVPPNKHAMQCVKRDPSIPEHETHFPGYMLRISQTTTHSPKPPAIVGQVTALT